MDEPEPRKRRRQRLGIQAEYRRCAAGKCATCDAGGRHGPYWYAYRRRGERVLKQYLGPGLFGAMERTDG